MSAPYPRAVIFLLDAQAGFPQAADLRKGIDTSITIYLVLAFYINDHPKYAANLWAGLSKEKQLDYVNNYHKPENNIKIMVSVGGGENKPTTEGWDPVVTAKNVVKFAKDNNLDGVDLDWEDTEALRKDPAATLKWIVTYTKTLRDDFATSIISHSPNTPYFCPTFPWDQPAAQKLYYKVDQEVGSSINFYNVMFYDTNSTDYETVEALIEKSSSNLPQSSLLEIARNPDFKSSINKLVIGKPVTKSDCSAGGYMAPKLLAESVQDAISKSAKDPTQWKAGIMGWQYHNASGFHDFVDPSAADLKA